jgi:hypothetical protein
MGPGYESRPGVVTAVKTTAKTLTVSEVRIRNTSSKSIASVKLGWTISNDVIKKGTILEGETSLMPIDKGLASGDTILLTSPILSFSEMKQEFSDAGNLKGNFEAYVFVSQIVFSDESRWKVGDKVAISENGLSPLFLNASFTGELGGLTIVPLKKALVCPK